MGLPAAGAHPVSVIEGHSSAVGSWALHAGIPDRAGVALAVDGGMDTLILLMLLWI